MIATDMVAVINTSGKGLGGFVPPPFFVASFTAVDMPFLPGPEGFAQHPADDLADRGFRQFGLKGNRLWHLEIDQMLLGKGDQFRLGHLLSGA